MNENNKKKIGEMFEEILKQTSGDEGQEIPKEVKKQAMEEAIKEAKKDIKRMVAEKGDILYAEFKVEPQCSCGSCHVTVKGEFIAIETTPEGKTKHEGEIKIDIVFA